VAELDQGAGEVHRDGALADAALAGQDKDDMADLAEPVLDRRRRWTHGNTARTRARQWVSGGGQGGKGSWLTGARNAPDMVSAVLTNRSGRLPGPTIPSHATK